MENLYCPFCKIGFAYVHLHFFDRDFRFQDLFQGSREYPIYLGVKKRHALFVCFRPPPRGYEHKGGSNGLVQPFPDYMSKPLHLTGFHANAKPGVVCMGPSPLQNLRHGVERTEYRVIKSARGKNKRDPHPAGHLKTVRANPSAITPVHVVCYFMGREIKDPCNNPFPYEFLHSHSAAPICVEADHVVAFFRQVAFGMKGTGRIYTVGRTRQP